MNTYRTSTGERLTQGQIDYRITQAKGEVVKRQFEDHGYNFCEQCGRSSGTYLDCSHDISVKKAKDEGITEQCYNPGNITILCRSCHAEKDKNHVQFQSH